MPLASKAVLLLYAGSSTSPSSFHNPEENPHGKVTVLAHERQWQTHKAKALS